MVIVFYYMIALVIYCWIDEFILFKIPNNQNELLEGIDTLCIIHKFSLVIFLGLLLITIPSYMKNKLISINYIGLAYLKYTGLFLFTNTIDNYKYELRRILMWLFITPAMLDMFAKSNNISFRSLKTQYHLIPNILYILTYSFKSNKYYNIFYFISYISQILFVKNLYNFTHLKYTKIFIGIWLMFGILNIITILNLITVFESNIFYSIIDIIAKFTVMSIIYDFEEQKSIIRSHIDLQSVDLMGLIFNLINNYKKSNLLTDSCNIYVDYLENQLLTLSPNKETKNIIKLELLKKIITI